MRQVVGSLQKLGLGVDLLEWTRHGVEEVFRPLQEGRPASLLVAVQAWLSLQWRDLALRREEFRQAAHGVDRWASAVASRGSARP